MVLFRDVRNYHTTIKTSLFVHLFYFLISMHNYFRSFIQCWKILPATYKLFIVLLTLSVLVVLFVGYSYFSSQNEINKKLSRSQIPNPELPLPSSSSILHQFKGGAVCSDSEPCSKIGR